MKKSLLSLLLLSSCGAYNDQTSDTKIVGGTLASNQTYFAGIVNKGSSFSFCNGTFLNATTVVTAAHCYQSASTTQVRVGFDNSNPNSYNLLDIQSFTRHPSYNSSTMANDIAIIKLKPYDPATLKMPIEPIAYNSDPLFASSGFTNKIILYGTGATSASGTGAGYTLRTVQVPYVENTKCNSLYGGGIWDSNLCAGDTTIGGIDSCQGDSGGPALAMSTKGLVLVGVVSWGQGCADKRYPGVYTRVSSFDSWIKSNL